MRSRSSLRRGRPGADCGAAAAKPIQIKAQAAGRTAHTAGVTAAQEGGNAG